MIDVLEIKWWTMRSLTRRLSRAWSSYKYRFVPWIALNLNEKTAVKVEQSDIYSQEELVESLVITLSALEQYTSLREDLTLYDSLHAANQVSLLNEVGFSVSRRQSSIPGAGTGVFIQRGAVNKGDLNKNYKLLLKRSILNKTNDMMYQFQYIVDFVKSKKE